MIFVKPLCDEPVYSICARAAERLGYVSPRAFTEEVFGRTTITAVEHLPSSLNRISDCLTSAFGVTASALVWEHTLLPLYAPFQSASRITEVVQAMGEAGAIQQHLGLIAMNLPQPSRLRYCPQCVADDQEAGLDPYWRRVHQVDFVRVCPEHNVFLKESNVQTGTHRTHRHEFIALANVPIDLESQPLDHSKPSDRYLFLLAKEAVRLLTCSLPSFEPRDLQLHYLQFLREAELATMSGQIRAGKLVDQFQSSLGIPFLRSLGCSIPEESQDNWLLRLVRKPRVSQHPLQHLLLLLFLGKTCSDLLKPLARSHVALNGSWPCLNRTTDHFQELTIKVADLLPSAAAGGNHYKFCCPLCEFTYSRQIHSDAGTYERVIRRGHVWEAKLREMWQDKAISLRQLSRLLGVDPKTAQHHATRLRLPQPRPHQFPKKIRSEPTREKIVRDVQADIDAWNTALIDADGSVKIARQVLPSVYAALYRRDPSLVRSSAPRAKRPSRPCLDWDKRDRELVERVEQAVAYIKAKNKPYCRLTVASIARELKATSNIYKHPDKLPKTIEKIKLHIENREQFAVRRVVSIIDGDEYLKTALPVWMIARTAGLRYDLLHILENDKHIVGKIDKLAVQK